jgi:hypothetical protein
VSRPSKSGGIGGALGWILILDQAGADMADVPGGASGLLVRDYNGKEADREGYRADPGVASLVAELRGKRQAAEEPDQRKAHHEERKVTDASLAAITLVLLLTDEELDSLEKTAGDGEIAIGGRPRWIRCRKPSTGCALWGACPSVPRECRGPARRPRKFFPFHANSLNQLHLMYAQASCASNATGLVSGRTTPGGTGGDEAAGKVAG